ncbi:DUF1611 domain-containing protein [bacterium]|nr:DUF1611 domain-containing protein [candidate division CSSED10-310 bacterium]
MRNEFPEGTAVVYCDGAFGTTNGKTAHGLVRRTRRYRVAAVIDQRLAGCDAGVVLDGRAAGIPIVADLAAALAVAGDARPTHFVIGLAPDGGRLPDSARLAVREALESGLNVDSGLHDFLSDDPALGASARAHGVAIRDIRKPPGRECLHFFSGRIEDVDCLTVALLGTDSAVGKRTTAWLLLDALAAAGVRAELVGTGQTAWLQGVSYGIILDSLVNDFVAGEIEHAVWSAWRESRPQVIIIEGQGSLMNPAYPGGYEILAAGRPDVVIMQHAPARHEYDGFPGYPLHPIATQIAAVELVSDRPVVGITINHEGMSEAETLESCRLLGATTGLPVVDPLRQDLGPIVAAVMAHDRRSPGGRR